MQDKKIVSYVANPKNTDVAYIMKNLERDFNIKGHPVTDIRDVFPLLADPTFNTDYITVYVEDFYKVEDVGSFEIIQALDTLLKCTVYRPDSGGKPRRRTTKIVAVISSDTPVEVIKDILEFDSISFLTPGGGLGVTYDDIKEGVRNFIENKERIPPAIKKLLTKAKGTTKKKSDTIILTPRQKQIFELVSNRGASNKIIARTLNITESTVKLHMGAILKKYNVKNRTQLAVFSKQDKFISEV